MKTYGKARFIFPDLIVIDGKMYTLTVRPVSTDHTGLIESIEKRIVLEEVESENEDLGPGPQIKRNETNQYESRNR